LKIPLRGYKHLNPTIFLNAPPQSASTYLYNSLTTGLNYKCFNQPLLYGGIFPKKSIVTHWAQESLNGHYVWQDNVEASEINLLIIEQYFKRIVLHFRDPRQCIFSWIHHFPNVMHEVRAITLKKLLNIDDTFFSKTIEQQIDHLIETRFLHYIEYYKNWLNVLNSGKYKIKFLVTLFEEVLIKPNDVLKRILDFYEINETSFVYPKIPIHGQQNFRGNSTEGWQKVFTEKQKRKTSMLIPQEMKTKFNWED
jgi:hypothetical protein